MKVTLLIVGLFVMSGCTEINRIILPNFLFVDLKEFGYPNYVDIKGTWKAVDFNYAHPINTQIIKCNKFQVEEGAPLGLVTITDIFITDGCLLTDVTSYIVKIWNDKSIIAESKTEIRKTQIRIDRINKTVKLMSTFIKGSNNPMKLGEEDRVMILVDPNK